MASIAEWRKFITNETETEVEWRTIEIYHPELDQVYRFIDGYNDRVLTLEATAPRNAGQPVTFTKSTLFITEPSERQDGEQILEVRAGNTDQSIYNIIDQITGQGYFTEAEIVYRKYYSGDTSEPAATPLYLFASNINFNNETEATFIAEDSNLSSRRVGILYTTDLFQGLIVD